MYGANKVGIVTDPVPSCRTHSCLNVHSVHEVHVCALEGVHVHACHLEVCAFADYRYSNGCI